MARLTFYATLSLALIFIDSRFQTLELLRQGVSLFTHPVQQVVHAPLDWLENASGYFGNITRFQTENAQLKRAQLDNAGTLLRARQLEAENERLRKLLEIKERQQVNGQVTQILHAARDPFSHRLIVDKGQQNKIIAGQPVVDAEGVVGQVTRVFPFVSEITLITDKDQAVPVQVLRNGLRSVVFGLGNNQLELRYMPVNADVQNGDLLVTSGLDGIFLPGLPVARVVRVERDSSYSFASIVCEPLAGVENSGEVMVIDPPLPSPLPVELVAEPPQGTAKSRAKAAGKKR